MADDIPIAPLGTPFPVVTDELAGGRHVQVFKVGFGPDGLLTFAEDAAPLPTVTRFNLPAVPRLASAQINIATAGDNTLLAGTAAQTIRVFRFWLTAAADVQLHWKDGSTAFHPVIPVLANGAWVLDFDGEPWFTTTPGTNLIMALSLPVQVSGRFYYVKG